MANEASPPSPTMHQMYIYLAMPYHPLVHMRSEGSKVAVCVCMCVCVC